jgi:S1-C subfamily serine protease
MRAVVASAGDGSFVAYFGLLQASIYYPPRPLGLTFFTRHGQTFVGQVVPESRASAAGFQPGDRIVSGSGLRISDDNSVRVLTANIPVNQPVTWELSRAEKADIVR